MNNVLKKAKNEDVKNLFNMAFNHESLEGDDPEKRRLIRFAHEHEMQHLLPDEAHGMMHDMHVPHNHAGIQNDEEGYHEHPVVKAGDLGEIFKSWFPTDEEARFEGWLSTPTLDREQDITEPEAFISAAQNYFYRMAPLSVQHGTQYLPIGHLQKAAILRDGKVLADFSNPTDEEKFQDLPSQGSGVWVRGVVNEEPGLSALRKKNVRGMSYIAKARSKEPLPGGRWRYTEFDPWVESTISAYPINNDAVIDVVKAYDNIPMEKLIPMPKTLEEILKDALVVKAAQEAPTPTTEETLTMKALGSLLLDLKTSILTDVSAEIKKAMPAFERGQGTGRHGTISPPPTTETTFESDPVNWVVKKAASGEEWSLEEKQFVAELTLKCLKEGLVSAED
jgi:hypothetical protein